MFPLLTQTHSPSTDDEREREPWVSGREGGRGKGDGAEQRGAGSIGCSLENAEGPEQDREPPPVARQLGAHASEADASPVPALPLSN